ncbi:MAG TPA: NRDE family protein [Candidatus Avamphibacillus sp.]|nr:NRDE family protein [Candidatus Avamphibacillus sp.]
MCLINFQVGAHPNYKLIVAANRDEFYGRPTASAHFWKDEPKLLAGRDLKGMGTWLGVTKEGRFAALTNIRDPEEDMLDKKSRGEILRNYLTGEMRPELFLEDLKKEKDQYAGFNLLVGSPEKLFYFNNRKAQTETIKEGVHGLSNHYLNTPWPKVVKGKDMLKEYTTAHEKLEPEVLFEILANSEEAPDESLPQTGVGIDFERKLSPLFIQTPDYGTRASTVLLVDIKNNVTFIERTYNQGELVGDEKFTFKIK